MGFMRILGIFLGLTAVGLSMYSLMSPKWAVSVKNAGGLTIQQEVAVGLWKYCSKSGSASNYNCQPLGQFSIQILAQMGVVGFRALMIIGLIAGFGGFCAGVTSTDAVNVAKSSKAKGQSAGGAAGGFLVGGLCVLAATSWAAHKIIKRYSMIMGGSGMNNMGGLKWTLGASIYCGWVAAFLFIGCAVIMFCGCCQNDDEEEYDDYAPSHPHGGYAESGYSQGKKEFV